MFTRTKVVPEPETDPQKSCGVCNKTLHVMCLNFGYCLETISHILPRSSLLIIVKLRVMDPEIGRQKGQRDVRERSVSQKFSDKSLTLVTLSLLLLA